jgi:hypothetical protein
MVIDGIGGLTDLPATFWLVVTTTAVGFGAWWSRPATALGLAALAFLTLDGFVVEHLGLLVWHGSSDVLRLALLVAVALGVSWERNRASRTIVSTLCAEPWPWNAQLKLAGCAARSTECRPTPLRSTPRILAHQVALA